MQDMVCKKERSVQLVRACGRSAIIGVCVVCACHYYFLVSETDGSGGLVAVDNRGSLQR